MTPPENGKAERRVGVYVYGIVPGDVELVPDSKGVGDPPGEIQLVHQGDVAALVSEVELDKKLGRAADLKLHERLLDSTVAAEIPVLPLRFGAVLSSREAVSDELLGTNSDLFASALEELEGRAEYIVQGRYEEEAVLREVLSENSAAASLKDQLKDLPEDEAENLRIELGETIHQAVEAKREADSGRVIEALADHVVATAAREPSHELDAVNVAVLAKLSDEKEIEESVEALASDWEGRVNLRLRGPLAPYDFVVQLKPGD
ncbi:GvpL/GvpF family gas vesicle protein [Glycomyces luteolus]|uniref:GvpL/GvpF family gas vesicle protein n=1 Tax=Glycomyces luteolus TaxID=2670330 RepID=A0A9X3P8G1_9ACTN|nr:GvpL/GvpF family gas vesicle protein [Glycomyces luteolus]MDA1360711.1 GvpL/GvpF family gas vesicle protein [Glycomyces luteolus]